MDLLEEVCPWGQVLRFQKTVGRSQSLSLSLSLTYGSRCMLSDVPGAMTLIHHPGF